MKKKRQPKKCSSFADAGGSLGATCFVSNLLLVIYGISIIEALMNLCVPYQLTQPLSYSLTDLDILFWYKTKKCSHLPKMLKHKIHCL